MWWQLLDALEWCLELGIGCVSVYAFSIDNYKRPPDEVAMLMALAEAKLQELLHVGALSLHPWFAALFCTGRSIRGGS